MLLVGSDDGIYTVADVFDPQEPTAARVLDADRVVRLRTFEPLDGIFAATMGGLYHSPDGEHWTDLGVPQTKVYAVCTDPEGDRLYAGTRPAHIYVTDITDISHGDVGDDLAWRDLKAFHALADRDDWGIDRHDDIAQVRSIHAPADAPDRLVAGIEVGGVYVSNDRGETWTDRSITGYDAHHTDDIHHLVLEDADTMTAATGSGLYRTTDTGRTWTRLDTGHRQNYFRESSVHDGTLYAGGSPTSPSSWEDDRDHALFRRAAGGGLESLDTPVPDEVVAGWCETADGNLLGATNRGTLLHLQDDTWHTLGTIPVAESVHGRCIPMTWTV